MYTKTRSWTNWILIKFRNNSLKKNLNMHFIYRIMLYIATKTTTNISQMMCPLKSHVCWVSWRPLSHLPQLVAITQLKAIRDQFHLLLLSFYLLWRRRSHLPIHLLLTIASHHLSNSFHSRPHCLIRLLITCLKLISERQFQRL